MFCFAAIAEKYVSQLNFIRPYCTVSDLSSFFHLGFIDVLGIIKADTDW